MFDNLDGSHEQVSIPKMLLFAVAVVAIVICFAATVHWAAMAIIR